MTMTLAERARRLPRHYCPDCGQVINAYADTKIIPQHYRSARRGERGRYEGLWDLGVLCSLSGRPSPRRLEKAP